MTHGFEHEIAQAADDSLAPELRHALDAHLSVCDACRALLSEQRDARALLLARPIVPVRDLSAAIRATLEAERPWQRDAERSWPLDAERSWIDRLNINFRVWSLGAAPVAAALVVAAVMLVRTADTSTEANATSVDAASVTGTDAAAPVVSALWSGEVSEDALFNLFLRARPDDALSNYVQVTPGASGAKEQ